MCARVCLCACVHTCACARIHIVYVRACVCMCLHVHCVCVCMCMCVHACVHVCACACMCTVCVCACTCVCVRTCVHCVCVCTCVHTCACACMCTVYVCMCVHVHVCACMCTVYVCVCVHMCVCMCGGSQLHTDSPATPEPSSRAGAMVLIGLGSWLAGGSQEATRRRIPGGDVYKPRVSCPLPSPRSFPRSSTCHQPAQLCLRGQGCRGSSQPAGSHPPGHCARSLDTDFPEVVRDQGTLSE